MTVSGVYRFRRICLLAEKKRISQDEFNCFMMDREKDMEVLTMVSPGLALAKKYIEQGRAEGLARAV